MNDILRPYLQWFVLVFIYSVSWANHLQHVWAVLELMSAHSLFLKRSKCTFVVFYYLGQIISADGVAMDGDKVRLWRHGQRRVL